MAMFDYLPQLVEKGRWYRLHVTSNGSAISLASSDVEGVTPVGRLLSFPVGFHLCHHISDYHAIAGGTQTAEARGITASGRNYLELPRFDTFDDAYIYVWGYFE